MPNDITPQIRLNAALSYLLLWPIFLIARQNPNLEHPHIRHHAKRASKMIWGSILYYLIFALLIHPLIREIHVPIVHMTLSSVILTLSSFLILFAFLSSAYQVFSGWDEKLLEDLKESTFGAKKHRILSGEKEKIITLLSLVPIVSAHIFSQDPYRDLARYGYILSSAFLTIFLVAFFSDPVSSWTLIFGALGISVLSYLGICALFRWEQVGIEYISRIPTLQDIELSLVTLPVYIRQYLRSSKWDTPLEIIGFGQMASDLFLSHKKEHEEEQVAYPHRKNTNKIIHLFANIPGVSLISSYAAYRGSRESFFALMTSAVYGLIFLIGWYMAEGWIIGMSSALLLIHTLKSYHQAYTHSLIIESLRWVLKRYMQSTHQKTQHMTSQITRVEEKKY